MFEASGRPEIFNAKLHFGGSRSHQSENKESRIRYLMRFEGFGGVER
jgi:hypothetical protein